MNTAQTLFFEWKSRHEENEVFVEDGIIDPIRWNKINKKILFLLKEPGDDIKGHCGEPSMIVLFTKLWNGVRYSFKSLGRWAYGLKNATGESFPSYDQANKKINCDEAFLSSAFMNLKKTSSKFEDNSCDENLLLKYADKYKDEIKRQIELINADIVVCCGWSVFGIIEKYFSLSKIDSKLDVYKSKGFKNMIFLRACHPSSRKWKNNHEQVRRKATDRYSDLMSEYQAYLAS